MTSSDNSLSGPSTEGTGPDAVPEPRMGSRLDRLPPPAFPPGHRRSWVHRPRPDSTGGEMDVTSASDPFPADAFSSPDAPIRRIQDPAEAAGQARIGGVGLGDGEYDAMASSMSRDDVADVLMELAREVRVHQSGRLLWKPGASPLEGALRGLLSGFLREPE